MMMTDNSQRFDPSPLKTAAWWFATMLLSSGCAHAAAPTVSPAQVWAFVEALRLAAPQTGREDDGLYSEWQVKPDNIRRWSARCVGQELTPEQFEANPAIAREVIVCAMGDVLRQQYEAGGREESLAVQRAASWWLTGDPEQYRDQVAPYAQRVLGFYRQELP
jgi:hypothetical protein